MIKIKDELVNDGWNHYNDIDWFFENSDFRVLLLAIQFETIQRGNIVYDNVGHEVKLDLVFGLDGDLPAKSLRRFIEKF